MAWFVGIFISSIFLVVGFLVKYNSVNTVGRVLSVSECRYAKQGDHENNKERVDRRLAIKYDLPLKLNNHALTSDWTNKYLTFRVGQEIRIKVVSHKNYDEVYVPSVSKPIRSSFVGYTISALILFPFLTKIECWVCFFLVSGAMCGLIFLFFSLIPEGPIPPSQVYREDLIKSVPDDNGDNF